MRKSSLPRAASRKPRRRLEEELTEHPSSAEGYALLGIVYSEQKNTAAALAAFEEVLELEIYKNAIERNPDNDQSYLSLALLELRTLGVFYCQTGRIDKAREVLNRFKGSGAGGGLDVGRIEEALQKAPAIPLIVSEPLPMASRQQLLEFALSVADRTL